MDKRLKLCYCKIETNSDVVLSATQLRSYIGYKFAQDTEFHHHDDNPYRYPLIQYKRVDSKLYVLGIGDYADLVLDRISGLQNICLKNIQIPITNVTFTKKQHTITDDITTFEFCSPWIALNQSNYAKYNNLDKTFRKKFLERILTANLLSALKGLGCMIDYDLYVKIKWFKHMPVTAHEHGFSGFYGAFVANVSLPQYLGIGKSVSKGFGILEKTQQ